MEFEVKMSIKALFGFQLRQMYTGITGWIFIIIALLMAGLYFYNGNVGALIGGAIVLFYVPWSLFLKSFKQIKLNPIFKKPIRYIVDDEGIHVVQDFQTDQITWEQLHKVVKSRQSVLIFSSRVNAFIIPRKDLGEKIDELMAIIKENMAKEKVK
jgi:hypothetical protein